MLAELLSARAAARSGLQQINARSDPDERDHSAERGQPVERRWLKRELFLCDFPLPVASHTAELVGGLVAAFGRRVAHVEQHGQTAMGARENPAELQTSREKRAEPVE